MGGGASPYSGTGLDGLGGGAMILVFLVSAALSGLGTWPAPPPANPLL